MRCFIAIPIPDGVKKSILNYINRVKDTQSGIRWVKEENIHITLRFLGEIKEEMVTRVGKLIEEKSKDYRSFDVELGGTGYFPSARRARVVWIGAKQGSEEMIRISEEIEKGLINLGLKKEKPFHAHLTIGRVRNPRPLDLPDFDHQLFTTKKIIFYKSTLTPKGPIYEVISEGDLG